MLHAHLATLALAATALAASGCGGSSKTVATTTAATTTAPTPATPTGTPTTVMPTVAVVKLANGKPLTSARWVADGDAICARLNTQLAANPVQKTKSFAVVIPLAAAYERAEVNQLAKLVPPASKAKDWQTILSYGQQWAENTAALGRTAQTSQFTLKDPLVATTTKVLANLMHIAKRDGFKVCSAPPA